MSDPREPATRPADAPEYLEAEPIPPASRPGPGPGMPAAASRTGSPGDVRKAWMVALIADFLPWVLFPVFLGAGVGVNAAVDLIVAFLMLRWMGWHHAFLPAFVTELVPIANFVPSWTLAMWIVTRLRGARDR